MNPLTQISVKLQRSITPALGSSIAFRLFGPLLALLTAVLFTPMSASSATLRIGYQKAASTLVLLKAHGTLERKLAPLHVDVKWLEFAAGPQLLEGLNLGSIDFGYVGEVPPIFALAAGAPLVYTAYELPTPEAEGILVPKDSPIRTIADLKGKKVAFNKGSDVHWLVVKALEDAGIKYGDIQPAYLAPADARAAFQNGAVDAWAIWDPFFVAAQRQIGARVLTTAKGIVNRHQYFVSTRSFSEKNAEVVKILMEELGGVGQWVRDNYAEAAKELAPIQGLEPDIVEASLRHYEHIYKPIDDAVLADQQRIADTFYDLKLIPQKLTVKDAVVR
ncbi:MAG: sulfonate ABC transporter substrate-binding protein [Verrucomicrobia bacterium]|nr:sulfonate ABC transporter substrate-binding protein [Verrucomicrobiota bacterium]